MQTLLTLARSQRLAWAGLVLVFVQAAALALWSGDSLRYFDEQEYSDIAHALLHRHAFALDIGVTLARPPGYPFLLAGIYAVVDSPLAAKFVNCAALAISAWLLIRLGRRLRPSCTALVPLAVLCYPLFFYAASTLYPQTVGGLLMLAVILRLAHETLRPLDMAIAGITLGVLCLLIPSFLYIAPILGLYVLYRMRSQPRRMLALAALLALVTATTIAPWTIRNYISLGAFVPISANSGVNLALGNSAASTPNGKPTILGACPDVPYYRDEAKFDHELGKCALRWIRANPQAALRLYVGKFSNYFNYRNELSTADQQKPWQEWLVFASYYPLLLLAIVRLGFYRRYPLTPVEGLLYIIYVGNAALTAVFFTRLRFRIPFDLLLVAIDAGFLAYLLEWRTGRTASLPSAPNAGSTASAS